MLLRLTTVANPGGPLTARKGRRSIAVLCNKPSKTPLQSPWAAARETMTT
jgi:hypothetical protein